MPVMSAVSAMSYQSRAIILPTPAARGGRQIAAKRRAPDASPGIAFDVEQGACALGAWSVAEVTFTGVHDRDAQRVRRRHNLWILLAPARVDHRGDPCCSKRFQAVGHRKE